MRCALSGTGSAAATSGCRLGVHGRLGLGLGFGDRGLGLGSCGLVNITEQ